MNIPIPAMGRILKRFTLLMINRDIYGKQEEVWVYARCVRAVIILRCSEKLYASNRKQ